MKDKFEVTFESSDGEVYFNNGESYRVSVDNDNMEAVISDITALSFTTEIIRRVEKLYPDYLVTIEE